MLTIYTIQIARPYLAQSLGAEIIDITIKSGDRRLAPTWELVWGIKKYGMPVEEYTVQYTEMMRNSFRNNKAFWMELLSKEKIALACYCPKRGFCHRNILLNILVSCCKHYNIEYTLGGEI